MEALLIATVTVALAEIGDKTQLLAILLATRYKPLPIILGISFIAMAAWMLVPDELDAPGASRKLGGVFVTTTVLFFVVEIGDKTQLATVALAARFDSLTAVVLGTTIGMILANAPVAFFGEALAKRLPVRAVHLVAAIVFAALGVGVLAFG